jgi:tetratricopeptide (TPR) repeat protein
LAWGMAARCYAWRKANGWMTDRAQETAEAERLARRAVDLGKDDAVALGRTGQALAYVVGDLENGRAFIARALDLNQNLAVTWLFSGWVQVYIGKPDTAIEHAACAMRLSPFDPMRGLMQAATAFGHFFAGRYDEAAWWARDALREQPNFFDALRVRLEEAATAMRRLREADPLHRISNLNDRIPLRRLEDRARLEDGLRKAGLPE